MNTKRYDLSYIFYIGKLNPTPKEVTLRYWMVGIRENSKFIGIIRDYCGGGCWDTFYFLQGVSLTYGYYLQKTLFEDDDCLEEETQEGILDKHRPDLVTQIYDYMDTISTVLDDGRYVIKETFRDICGSIGKDNRIWTNNEMLQPISVGNTYFS